MPLPLILGVGAAIAGITGVGSGAYGAGKCFVQIFAGQEAGGRRYERERKDNPGKAALPYV